MILVTKSSKKRNPSAPNSPKPYSNANSPQKPQTTAGRIPQSHRVITTSLINRNRELIPTYDKFFETFNSIGNIVWSDVFKCLETRWTIYRALYAKLQENSIGIIPDDAMSALVKVTKETEYYDNVSFALFFAAFCDFQANARHYRQLASYFVQSEMSLFAQRIATISMEGLDGYLRQYDYHPQPITDVENVFLNEQKYFALPLVKVPFYEAGKFFRTRELLLRDGFAFISKQEIIDLVTLKYRGKIQEIIKEMGNADLMAKVPTELHPMLQFYMDNVPMVKSISEKGYAQAECSIEEARESLGMFAPCAFSIYRRFKREKHLKHFGKLQLVLFLKGMGLDMDGTKKYIDEVERLDKDAIYAIEHAYGKVGGKKDYSSYGCVGLMSHNRNVGDCDGCIMNTLKFSKDDVRNNLKDLLDFRGVEGNERESIYEDVMNSVDAKLPMQACTKLLCLLNGKAWNEEVPEIAHPNNYYRRFKKMVNEKNRDSVEKLIDELKMDEEEIVENNEETKKEVKMEIEERKDKVEVKEEKVSVENKMDES
ncbi:DNA primase large subunit, putative [Entamoeba invadens IP1]|uniref:DNA primase large subunit, putative n=1 Tax=Entamoeba invadens IP1 TaxID=370355 RepID=A0A0A1TW67_ENTIV|nr:DNA primase large subunit, putative [Entamoeba invadens IP1]ELP83528.1 DNA primase large subunit, putative [Entamoeba invadens IP1]|eukprot:XP_004182874.1 DNA primase large subunit, putative [Entamoeba invadens IP1]